MVLKTILLLFLTFANLLHTDEKIDVWEATEAVWGCYIMSRCDVGMKHAPLKFFERYTENYYVFDEKEYQNINSGDVVWLRCAFVPQFYQKILPKVQHPFVLIINDGVDSFPSECGLGVNDIEDFISNEHIIHIFAQNCDYKGKSTKISHLPVGIDFHTVAYRKEYWGEVGSPKKQEEVLKKIMSELQPTYLRKKGAFVDFQHNDTARSHNRYQKYGEDRKSIFERLVPTGLIEYSSGPMKRSDLWKTKGRYAFSISPHGAGLDCLRTWEDLILGCIVIVKTSPLDPLYEGLPVVIVKDWSEITRENMEKWLARYGDAFTNTEYRIKLTNAYWLEKIQTAARPYKEIVQE